MPSPLAHPCVLAPPPRHRYCLPHHVSDAVSLPGTLPRSCGGLSLLLSSFFRPQCHPVLLDAAINSLGVVAMNLACLVALAAAKLVCALHKPQLAGVVGPEELVRCGGRRRCHS